MSETFWELAKNENGSISSYINRVNDKPFIYSPCIKSLGDHFFFMAIGIYQVTYGDRKFCRSVGRSVPVLLV